MYEAAPPGEVVAPAAVSNYTGRAMTQKYAAKKLYNETMAPMTQPYGMQKTVPGSFYEPVSAGVKLPGSSGYKLNTSQPHSAYKYGQMNRMSYMPMKK